jgi:hypothetical protein
MTIQDHSQAQAERNTMLRSACSAPSYATLARSHARTLGATYTDRHTPHHTHDARDTCAPRARAYVCAAPHPPPRVGVCGRERGPKIFRPPVKTSQEAPRALIPPVPVCAGGWKAPPLLAPPSALKRPLPSRLLQPRESHASNGCFTPDYYRRVETNRKKHP